MTMTVRTNREYQDKKDLITGLSDMTQEMIDKGYQGYLMTFMFKPLQGGIRQKNHQMQVDIEGLYGSLLTRLHRKPNASRIVLPNLIACPDWPLPKHKKKSLEEIVTNDGLHHHGILLIPPTPNRLKVPLDQHFDDNQSYYLRDGKFIRIDVEPIAPPTAYDAAEYVFKGLKKNRLPGDEDLLMLPNRNREMRPRTYLGSPNFGK